ncbi:MAG TPA: 23S rRNA (guanosine(2251)-2'-O)-methyltransferase RlmB [Gammaproteobacteria bacterium]|nr:23S rRNA (guanosine(2251)-2'-O)-methyltransferase RlmB [Gammaproteobacteria bacterium]
MASSQDWIIGFHAVTELLKHQSADVLQLVIQDGRNDERLQALKSMALQANIELAQLAKREMDRRFPGVHQGVAALYRNPVAAKSEKELGVLLDSLDRAPLLLVLDGITDPHNLGACLRSADAAGVDAVITPKDKSATLNATVHKVASGAAETVPLFAVGNLARCLESLQRRGIWLVGTADETGKSLFDQDLTGALALVMGSEGRGLRRLTRERCDYLVAIPMAGKLSSLNVSVATGVCLFEALRQRQKGN